MTATGMRKFDEVFKKLEDLGLLLVSGNEFPDVRRLVTGKDAKGSWWTDAAAHTIFAVNAQLSDHPDVLVAKLISRKVTFVHRKLWSRFYSIATARDDWQTNGLSAEAKRLLHSIDVSGTVATNKLRSTKTKPGDLARELERRLLVHADQVHTESGAHAKVLETWSNWTNRVTFEPRPVDPEAAQLFFELRVEEINREFAGSGQLPWPYEII